MDKISKKLRSEIMSRIRSKDSNPEKILRKTLWGMGLRYRLYYGKEKIDIAFPSKKLAIFVDGCFWHRCPYHAVVPKTNLEYWMPKLEMNVLRAIKKDERLQATGWTVIHVWEHELKKPWIVACKIVELLDNI